jgi:hypothetical protein
MKFIRFAGRPEQAALAAATRSRADVRAMAAEVDRIEVPRITG